VVYLLRVEWLEDALGLELAIGGEEPHFQAFIEHPGK